MPTIKPATPSRHAVTTFAAVKAAIVAQCKQPS
jgi:hypothetical protein